MVKNLPAGIGGTREMSVRSLVQEDTLEKEMDIPSSIHAWKIPIGQRSLVGYSPWSHRQSDTTEGLSTHTHTHTENRP